MKLLGDKPLIDPTASVRDCTFGRYTEVGARTSIAETTMGDYSYVVNDSEIIYTTIGKFVSIAAMTRINPGNHPMERASQSHFTYRASASFDDVTDDAAFFERRRMDHVSVSHDVWIGHGAIILAGCSIGTGAVVAAGAVVSRDVAPYTIVAGVAARPIRRRFPEGISDRLIELAWWDWDHVKLRGALEDFKGLTVEAFLEKHEP